VNAELPTHTVSSAVNGQSKLYFLCGKMAAGKSTLARKLAQELSAVLLVEDEFLASLYPGEIADLSDYVRCSGRLKESLNDLICSLVLKGMPVVLDFPGNTKKQRIWFRRLIEKTNEDHELHFIDAEDDVCKQQLKKRSRDLAESTAFTSEREFDAITAYFQAPAADEGFNLIVHRRT
jgi:predicted kinase